ncbi:MAG: bifunctional folylpolyglutamate synthase/dihydrofolate synthase, partial [Cytophagales bacterium]|nr:bifunctional folylpolyglutamate synthase/dihydrofolate synthase [Cytophagales bacterium]
DFFAKEQVDIAIIEVGLGGRLDSTNVIRPLISLITNISYDHMDILGDTLPQIASEKAGIIKPGVPVVISETQPEITEVFNQKAKLENASIYFADQEFNLSERGRSSNWMLVDVVDKQTGFVQTLYSGLTGTYQLKNLAGVLKTADLAKPMGFVLSQNHIGQGIQHVLSNTGLKGRWNILSQSPMIVCDIAHNEAGVQEVLKQISVYQYQQLWIVLGMVADKDVDKVLSLMPKEANYIFCQANLPRALDAQVLADKANGYGLMGKVIKEVNKAIDFAKTNSAPHDFIFIGGSTFVVAEIDNL